MATSLQGALLDTQRAYAALDQYARAQGITIAIADFGGLRTQADTNRILGYREQDYRQAVDTGAVNPATMPMERWRPIAPFGSSYHNYGAAFDVAIVARPSSLGSDYAALALLGAYAPSIGLRWGGGPDFPANRKDPPHFELAIPLADARQRYQDATGAAIATALPGGNAMDAVDEAAYAADPGGVFDVSNLPFDTSADANLPTPDYTLYAFAAVGAVVAAVWFALVRRGA